MKGKDAEQLVCQYVDFSYPRGIRARLMKAGPNGTVIHAKLHISLYKVMIWKETMWIY